MEEEFYSTIKLTSGEELVAKVCFLPEENSVLLHNPMLVEKMVQKKKGKQVSGFILKEWITSTYDDMFVIPREQIITMSELDDEIKNFYINGLTEDPETIDIKPEKFSKRMGYLGSVKEAKNFLENIYKKS